MEQQYFIIRCAQAGVFFAQIADRRGGEVDLVNARKIWYWSGAAAVEQLAMTGPKDERNCKITVEVPSMTVMEACQIIPCTQEAAETIQRIAVWKR